MGKFAERKKQPRRVAMRFITSDMKQKIIDDGLVFSVIGVEGPKESTIKPPRGKSRTVEMWELILEFLPQDVEKLKDFEGYLNDDKEKPLGLREHMILSVEAGNKDRDDDIESINEDIKTEGPVRGLVLKSYPTNNGNNFVTIEEAA